MPIQEIGTIRKKTVVDLETGARMPDISPVSVFINSPNGSCPFDLKKEDVWGEWDWDTHKAKSTGMVVASNYKQRCPYFKDILPYKSVTVVCEESQVDAVTYWLEYVHGGGCVSKMKQIGDGKVAIRSDYQCW